MSTDTVARQARILHTLKDMPPKMLRRIVPAIASECWLWTGGVDPCGYGRARMPSHPDGTFGRVDSIHRIAWAAVNGPIPDGMCVCHHCDTPPCCNPAHMFMGTHTDNMADKSRKGRCAVPFGSGHAKSKLTEALVSDMRRRHDNGVPYTVIAKELGMSPTTIRQACRGETWAHVR